MGEKWRGRGEMSRFGTVLEASLKLNVLFAGGLHFSIRPLFKMWNPIG